MGKETATASTAFPLHYKKDALVESKSTFPRLSFAETQAGCEINSLAAAVRRDPSELSMLAWPLFARDIRKPAVPKNGPLVV